MNATEIAGVTLTQIVPFGLIVAAHESGQDLGALPVNLLEGLVEENRVAVLRGFAPLAGDEFPHFCRRFGDLQEWDFGVVNNLQVKPDAENYLYTNRAVPFHWDGAFAGRVPHYIIFHCDAASSGSGGETLFCDTLRLLSAAPSDRLEQWRGIDVTYTTEKIVHYGGSFTSPLITSHPTNGKDILRFAEPVFDLNPVQLGIRGLADTERADFLNDMHQRLNDDAFCYRHSWRSGDVVIADNFVLLHGREEFAANAKRHIRRVNVF